MELPGIPEKGIPMFKQKPFTSMFRSFICDTPKLESVQTSFNRWMVKKTMARPYHGPLLSIKGRCYWHLKQLGWISREFCWMNKRNPNRLCTVWFCLHIILKWQNLKMGNTLIVAKGWEWGWRVGEVGVAIKGSLLWETCLLSWCEGGNMSCIELNTHTHKWVQVKLGKFEDLVDCMSVVLHYSFSKRETESDVYGTFLDYFLTTMCESILSREISI